MNKREMLIDLTSLLDVILIILFLVLMNQQTAQSQRVADLEEEVHRLELTQQPQTDSQVAWQLSFQEDVGKLNIIYPKKLDGSPLYLEKDDGSKIVKPVAENLKDWLLSQVNQVSQEVVMVVFTFDDHQIYYREYKNVLETVIQLNKLTDKKIIYSEYVLNK